MIDSGVADQTVARKCVKHLKSGELEAVAVVAYGLKPQDVKANRYRMRRRERMRL